jgi:hypothetical protein
MSLAICSGHISFGSPLTIITKIQSMLLVSTWMTFPDSVRHMMCDRTIQGAFTTYSAAHKVLSDTIGSCNVRTVTMIHGLGICREEQTRDLYCAKLEGAPISIKVVRTINIRSSTRPLLISFQATSMAEQLSPATKMSTWACTRFFQ